MKALHPTYIIDGNRKKTAVLLPIAEWEEILLAMEEIDDIRLYDEAKGMDEEVIPFEQAVREIENGQTGTLKDRRIPHPVMGAIGIHYDPVEPLTEEE